MQNILSVSDINRYIKEIISRDFLLSSIWVRGEISNYKNHYSGHMYFTLKDDKSLIKCVMFKTNASKLKFLPDNGMKVIIRGYISVFERDGQYQLYVEEMQPDGMGSLHIAFEQLKKKLEAEGLFDNARKKKLPFLPTSIGVVTSKTGAVIRDIINVLSRRFYNINIKLYPVAVQGEQAAEQIAKAIRWFNKSGSVDVIIVGRGGGSLEDLWAFNEEVVARSIFDSEIPVISAVGHETDFTIADFVADVRAPTPSAAAEIVAPERNALTDAIIKLNLRLRNSLNANLGLYRERLQRLNDSVAFRQPFNRIYQERMRLDLINKYLLRDLKANLESKKNSFSVSMAKLNALSPLNILSRGYSIARQEKTGIIIKSVNDVRSGDQVDINVADGKIRCSVIESINQL